MKDLKEKNTPDIFNNSMTFGYARVSTYKQNLDSQITALKEYGCDEVHQEKTTTRGELPVLKQVLNKLRTGDTLVVWKLDRLGRSLQQTTEIIENLLKRKVKLISITQDIDISTIVGKLVASIMLAIAEAEREHINERVMIGLADARKRGVVGGRKPKLNEKDIKDLITMYDSKKYQIVEIAKKFSITSATVHRYIKKYK